MRQHNIHAQRVGAFESPPKKLYSARTTVTLFHPQTSFLFIPIQESTSSYLIITGCDSFSELENFLSSFLFRLFRVAYTAISQFDTFPTRPSLFATTHTLLSLWSLIIDIHTFLAWLSSFKKNSFFFFLEGRLVCRHHTPCARRPSSPPSSTEGIDNRSLFAAFRSPPFLLVVCQQPLACFCLLQRPRKEALSPSSLRSCRFRAFREEKIEGASRLSLRNTPASQVAPTVSALQTIS